jgi:hypothetical protein
MEQSRINQCISYIQDHPHTGRADLINSGIPALIVDYAAHVLGDDTPAPVITVCNMPGTTIIGYGLDDVRLDSPVI